MPVQLSVCVPTYNGADFLDRCLRSLLAQDVDLCVIVGDDASTDDSCAVVRGLSDPRVELHAFDQRLDLAGNWNRTWALGRGTYQALVGQDDHVEPDWARRLIGLLEAHPHADLAFGRRRFEFADEESRRVVGDFFENRYPAMLAPFHAALDEVISPDQMLAAALDHSFEINLIGEPSFVMVRRSHPAVAAGFDASMRQMIDWEFFTRFFVDRPLLHTAAIVGTYHIHARASSIENAPLSRHYREFDYLLGVLLQRFHDRLSPAQRTRLEARREEARELMLVHERQEQEPT